MSTRWPHFRKALSLSLSVALFSGPVTAYAQKKPKTIKLKGSQLALSQEASEESSRENPDYKVVQTNYELALKKGAANILYAGLGRAFFRQGLCKEAQDAYQKALTAPQAEGIPPESVEEWVKQDLAEMKEQCPGTVNLECVPKPVAVRLNGPDTTNLAATCGNSVSLKPGQYQLTWVDGARRGEQSFQVQAMGEQVVKVDTNLRLGRLTVQCEDPQTILLLGKQSIPCDVPTGVVPGTSILHASLGDKAIRQEVQVEEGGEHKLSILLTSEADKEKPQEVSQVQDIQPDPELDPPDDKRPPAVRPAAASGGFSSAWGWTFLITGGLLTAGGGLASLQVSALDQQASDLADDENLTQDEFDTLVDDVDLYENLQWLGLGAGGAFLLTGVILLALSDDESPEATSLRWNLWGTANQAGVQLQGAW